MAVYNEAAIVCDSMNRYMIKKSKLDSDNMEITVDVRFSEMVKKMLKRNNIQYTEA